MIEPDVIDALWEKIEPVVFITRDQFARGMDDWEVEVVRTDGRIDFVTLVQGPEFHFESFGRGIPITRTMIMDRLRPIIEMFGFVMTRTPIGEMRQHRFNRAFGFREVGRDEFFINYRLQRE